VLSHEIGHLTDWLPNRTMKRGNILGRLFTLRAFLKHMFTAPNGTTITLASVTSELRGASKRWRPWDEATASKSFRDYRNSSKELYADAISMLFNDPGLLEQMAPTFYQQFFESMDAKPEVKRAFFELQDVLQGTPNDVIARRHGRVLAMFDGGDVKAVDLERIRRQQRLASLKDFWTRFRVEYIDKNVPFLDRARAVEKAGQRIPPAKDPRYLLSERNYLGGKLKGFVERHIQPIYVALQDAGIGWNEFGSALFYERIMAGDRSELANPLGLSPKEAAEQHTHLMRSLTPDNRAVLNAQMDAFRAGMQDVTETAYEAGLYSDAMHEQMQENPAYATYRVLDHLDEGVSAAVFSQRGTHKEIQNVADATILKALVTLQAAEYNTVKVGGFQFLHRQFPDEIAQAREVWTGKGHRPVEPKKGDPRKLVTYKDKGKLRGKYVDPFIADSLNDETASAGVIVKVLGFLNSRWFRPVFTTFNVGFQTFNVRRDFGRTWKAMPGMTLGRLLKRYAQAVPLARVRAFGPPKHQSPRSQQAYEDLLQAEEAGILSVTYNDIIAGRDTADSQIEEILAKYNLGGYGATPSANPVRRAATALLSGIKQVGDFIETLPKGAAIYEYKGAGEVRDIPENRQAFIRERVGTPDILAGGTRRQESNNLVLFSNAIVQALRADIQTAFVDPKTRSGFWWKTAAIDIVPKFVMAAAMAGAAAALDDDDDDWDDALARAFRNVTEYDRTNYNPIPLWTNAKGDTTYLRLPSDDTGRLIGGLVWKALGMAQGDKEVTETAAQVFDYVIGQAPGPTPTLGLVSDTLDFLRGKNVYDSYRSRFLFTEDELRAGGLQAVRKFVGYEFQEIGGGIVWRFYAGEQRPRDQTVGQKIIELPILSNIVGRWIKVSSYGAVERSREVQQRVAKGEAQRRLTERESVNDALRALSGANPASPAVRAKASVIVRDLYKALPAKEQARKLAEVHKKLRMGLVRGQADPLTDAVMGATSNAQKVASILDARNDMSAAEYEAWILRATQLGVISPAVRTQVRQARAQAQGVR